MFQVSQGFKDAIVGASRTLKAKVVIDGKEYDETYIEYMEYEDFSNPSDVFELGAVASATLKMSLLGVNETFEFATIVPYIGIELSSGETEYVPLGEFYCDDIARKKDVTEITCYDGMIKLEQAYFSDLTYPATITSVMNEICTKTGIQFAGTLPSYQFQTKPEGYTYREVVSFIAQMCGGFAKFGRDGKLRVLSYTETDEMITADHYMDDGFSKTKNSTFRIDKLTCKAGDSTLTKGTLSAGGSEILFENPFMTDAVLADVYNKLNGFEYLPVILTFVGNPAYEVGDIVTLVTVDGETIKIPIMRHKLYFEGGLTGEIESIGETPNSNQFDSTGTIRNKVERVIYEQALINEALINKANIQDLQAANAEINNLKANKADVTDLQATNARIDTLQVEKANVSDLQAVNAVIGELQTGKADVSELNAVKADINTITSNIADIDHLLAGNLTAENIKAGAITAESGIIAEGAIGDAQISSVSANKLTAGTIDTSKITIAGPRGQMKIQGNKLQIFDLQSGGQLLERISLGIDENNNASLVLRGADGQTVLLTQDGLTDAGFTDGYNKLEDGSLDPVKINISKVVESINEGTTQIDASKIEIDNQSLNVFINSLKQQVTEHSATLSSHSSEISALSNEIQLKVSNQTYQQDKANLENRLTTAEGSITTLAGQIELKANKTDVYTKTQVDQELGKKVDTTVYNQKIGELTTSIDGISANVSNLQTTVGQHGTSISNLQSQVDIQAGQISSKVDATYVQGAIADIQVGGRNYARELGGDNYNINRVYSSDRQYTTVVTVDGKLWLKQSGRNVFRIASIPIEPNTTYTWSFNVYKTGSEQQITVFQYDSSSYGRKNYIVGNLPVRIKHTFTSRSNSAHEILHLDNLGTSDEWYFSDFQLEKGNKATDWTPAPEDVQAEIDDVYQYASSEIQQLAGEVSTKAEASTVTALGNRVTMAENNISALQGEITQKVSQSTFNALENRVTQAESTITQTADDVTFAFERIDSIDGVLNSAVTTIDASGVTVKDGSFYLEDDTSDTKYSIVPKSNLLSDHSFEMVERTGSADLTYGDFAVKQQIESFGKWKTVGSPRLLSAHQTDWVQFSLFYFGSQAIVVSSTDYVEQHFPYIPGKTYTVSAYFTGSSRSTSGVPRIDVRLEQGVTEEVKKTWTQSFSSVTFGQKLTRCALTFTVPADADNNLGGDIVMVSIRADSGWVVADGVQVVEGETPTLYEPENAVWELLYGRYEGRGFTGDYTIVDYGSNENGNFVRFGQGLQICWFQTEINMAINNQYGVLYQNSMKWTYPATFAVTPNVCVGEARWSTGASWGTPTTTERVSTDIRVIDVASRNAGPTRIKAIAIGRWK